MRANRANKIEQTNWVEKVENLVADKVEDIIILFGRSAYDSFYPIGCDRRRESLNLVGLMVVLSLLIFVGGITVGNDMHRHNSSYNYTPHIEKYEDGPATVQTQIQAQVQSDKVYLIEETSFDKWVCNKLGLED